MSFEDANTYFTSGIEILSTLTAVGTTLGAGVALAALGTVGASSAFLALPVLIPAVLVGSVAVSKLAHAVTVHNDPCRESEGTIFPHVKTALITPLRNREFFSGLVLGGVTAGVAVVANHTAPYSALGIAGGLSAGLALASLGLTISALHDAYFAWCCYKEIKIPAPGFKGRARWNEATNQAEIIQVSNKDDIEFAESHQEVMRRAMHSSIVAALGWAAVTTGSVAAAMSLAPMLIAAAFLLGGFAITVARVYNDGCNFGLFNKKADSSLNFSDRILLRSIALGL
jgi:hypothetical protein